MLGRSHRFIWLACCDGVADLRRSRPGAQDRQNRRGEFSTDVAFYIAEKRGYFQAGRAQAEFIYFDSGAKMIVPLGSGALDAGGGAPPSAGLYNAVEARYRAAHRRRQRA